MTIVSHHNKIKWNYYKTIGSIVFGISLIILFTLSTVYHSLGLISQEHKRTMQAIDHIAIYFVIAGTYTPLVAVIIIDKGKHYKLGIFVLLLEWIAAAIGIYIKSTYSINELSKLVSNGYYLLMGWAIIIVIVPAKRLTPKVVKKWVFYGGLFYSSGVGFLIWEQLQFNHCIWHVFVIFGALTHYIAVLMVMTDSTSEKELYDTIWNVMIKEKEKTM